jgi:hypothetical protein
MRNQHLGRIKRLGEAPSDCTAGAPVRRTRVKNRGSRPLMVVAIITA